MLEINYIGDFEVIRDGAAVRLPPSRKTRALLAYLSLNPRRFSREILCELLWEIPDDPRGSLRWTLSKLRRAVDSESKKRIIADRTNVYFDASDVSIDVRDLLELVRGKLDETDTDALEAAARRFRGNFLDGMELSGFHNFHAWCVAERENVLQAQSALLAELVKRLHDDPSRALPYARRLVTVAPYDETARSDLIRLLIAQRFVNEAEQQYRLGVRMLQEVGAMSSGALLAAWKGGGAALRADSGVEQAQTGVTGGEHTPPPETGLVGRDREMGILRGAIEKSIESGHAGVVLLKGEPGIGKTCVLEAVAGYAREIEATLIEAVAYESESLRPFAFWNDAIRRADPGAASAIFSENTATNRERLFDGLGEYIGGTASEKCLVGLFDDVHWCDESSAVALQSVLRRNRDRAIVFVLACRNGEYEDNAPLQQVLRGLRHDSLLTEVELQPLSQDAASALIARLAPDSDAERLGRECAGNPLLARELARAEVEGDSGGSLAELVRERLGRMDEDGADVLRWAAVLSNNINIETLSRMCSQDAGRVGEALALAEKQAMLTATESGLRFSHELIGRQVYDEISPVRRQVMHRRVAGYLEENTALDLTHAADLAHHASLSGDSGLAARAMVSAGRLCLRFFAHDDALSLARRGMRLAENLPDAERICIEIDLHHIHMSAAPLEDWQASALQYVSLAERAVDHGQMAHARLAYHMAATLRWTHGHWTDAREQSLLSARVARGGATSEQITGLADTAKCLALLERDLSRADAMLMEADALARRENFHYHSIAAGLGMLRFHEGKLEEAEEYLKEARMLCKAAGERLEEYQANEYLVLVDWERGDYAGAMARSNELRKLGEKLREGSEEPFARALEALCRYALDERQDECEQPFEDLRVADAKHRLAMVLNRAAQLDLARGKTGRAIERASEALAHATLLQRASEMALSRIILQRSCEQSGDEKQAAEHQRSLESLLDTDIAAWATRYIN